MKIILILDDERVARESFVDFFEDCLWQPIQAGSAEEALKLLEHETPTAAVVDVYLPGMDGNDFIREVCRRNISMASVICTGSPEYVVPPDLCELPSISNRLFKKPITDLVADLEKEILRVIKRIERIERKEAKDE